MRRVPPALPVLALGAGLLVAATRLLAEPSEPAPRAERRVAAPRSSSSRAAAGSRVAPSVTAVASSAPAVASAAVATAAEVTSASGVAPTSSAATGRRSLHAGGSCCASTISAVTAGLRWLARHQVEDGGWSPAGADCLDGRCASPGAWSGRVGATATALLAFAGAGYTTLTRQTYEDPITRRKMSFGKVVKAGVAWLLERQRTDGAFGDSPSEHAAATRLLVVLDALEGGGRRDARRADAARSALARLTQEAPTRVSPAYDADELDGVDALVLGALAWTEGDRQVEPLLPGADVALAHLRGWTARGIDPRSPAAWLFCAQRLALERWAVVSEVSETVAGALLVPHACAPDLRAWEVAASALVGACGPRADAWRAALKAALAPSQVNEPRVCADGSWDLPGDPAARGGRAVMTALAVSAMSSYYGHEGQVVRSVPH